MRKIVFKNNSIADPENERLLIGFNLSYSERMKKAFDLMLLSSMFKKSALKNPQALGIVLKRKK